MSKADDRKRLLKDNRIEAIELFINDFDIITDCLYDSDLKLSKSDEYYRALLLIQGILEDIYIEERRLLNDI